MSNDAVDLSAEDAKLVTLARATRARARADEGAAVRDLDGRTYAAASVRLAHARPVGARGVRGHGGRRPDRAGLEAAVVLADGEPRRSTPYATSPAPACRCTSATRAARSPVARHLSRWA